MALVTDLQLNLKTIITKMETNSAVLSKKKNTSRSHGRLMLTAQDKVGRTVELSKETLSYQLQILEMSTGE